MLEMCKFVVRVALQAFGKADETGKTVPHAHYLACAQACKASEINPHNALLLASLTMFCAYRSSLTPASMQPATSLVSRCTQESLKPWLCSAPAAPPLSGPATVHVYNLPC